MTDLFDPLTLRGVTFRNRIGISPMCQYSSRDGFANDWHLVHLGSRAVGGAGLVIAEASAVEARGRISPEDLGIWSDAHIEPVARIVRFMCEHGAVAGIQIAHAGRKANVTRPWQGDRSLKPDEGAWQAIGPMAEAFDAPGGAVTHVPHAMDEADIQTVIAAFGEAAGRAVAAGFAFLEIHAAHGYLLHEFLSPLTNRRNDGWGGGFDARCRLTLEVVRAVRRVWPDDKPLGLRISAVDWVETGGWTLEDSVALARLVKAEGVDLIDASSGFNVPEETYPFGPGWQVPFAQRIRAEAGIASAAVGEITEPAQAAAIVANGEADLVLIATASLQDAYWPFHAARTLGRLDNLRMPLPYDYVIRGDYGV
jgi:2,4-dienoyl-CoA reductase-like NADH-dependent reductase (Old Yellow Enzyme family)